MPRKSNRRDNKPALVVPAFRTEAEEADWYFTHQDELLSAFKKAARKGTLGRGTAAKQARTRAITIRLNSEDLEMAQRNADELGLGYQTYLKMLIHKALAHKTPTKKRATA
jgi:predicted DNA binding CopG/RHH family protein